MRQKEYLEMSEISNKISINANERSELARIERSENTRYYEVGDVIRVSDSAAPSYLITMRMPEKNPSYYLSIATNGSTATIWKGLIKEKIGHIDMEGIFRQMEHALLYGGD